MTDKKAISEAKTLGWITAFENEPPLHSLFPMTLSNGKTVPGVHVVCSKCNAQISGDRIHGRVVQSLPHVTDGFGQRPLRGMRPPDARRLPLPLQLQRHRRRVARQQRLLASSGAAATHVGREDRARRPPSGSVVCQGIVTATSRAHVSGRCPRTAVRRRVARATCSRTPRAPPATRWQATAETTRPFGTRGKSPVGRPRKALRAGEGATRQTEAATRQGIRFADMATVFRRRRWSCQAQRHASHRRGVRWRLSVRRRLLAHQSMFRRGPHLGLLALHQRSSRRRIGGYCAAGRTPGQSNRFALLRLP